MKFELTNDQRLYFGLEPIEPQWERVMLKGDTYREESILYFDGDIIKRHIVSTENNYKESHYNDLTRARTFLLPVTNKGKEKKLTASVLESRQPNGVYSGVDVNGRIFISNYNTQTTFYDSLWERPTGRVIKPISEWVEDFIKTCEKDYLSEIDLFKKAKRRNVKYKSGDFFAFKISRTEYAFGRILLNIAELNDKKIISKGHGLKFLMGKAVLLKIYAYTSKIKSVNLDELKKVNALPSDYIMDNVLFYGQFELIGHDTLKEDEFDFPMSYGRHINYSKNCIFLQWGLIHLELPFKASDKYLVADNPFVSEESASRRIINPYGYYSIGFRPHYNFFDIKETIKNNGLYDFEKRPTFIGNFDLRNPNNNQIRVELMRSFGLDPLKSYDENCKLTKTLKS